MVKGYFKCVGCGLEFPSGKNARRSLGSAAPKRTCVRCASGVQG